MEKKRETVMAVSLSRDKGKHAARPECRRPQINILLLFVWEKLPASPWAQALMTGIISPSLGQGEETTPLSPEIGPGT